MCIRDSSGFDREELIKSALQGEQALREFLSHTSYAQGIELLADSLSPFEKWCDDLVLKQMLPTKLTAFGEGPLAAYLMAKQAEIKTVRKMCIRDRNYTGLWGRSVKKPHKNGKKDGGDSGGKGSDGSHL